jgi:hypothetical protein
VSVPAFIGKRPVVQSSTARSLFCACEIKGFFEDLDFQRLAAKLAFQFADPFFEPTEIGRWHDVVIGTHGFLAAIGHQPPPPEHQARGEPVAAGNITDRHARLHRLGYDRQLLLGREPPPPRNAGDDLDPPKRVGHTPSPRSVPGSSGYAAVRSKRGAVQLANPAKRPAKRLPQLPTLFSVRQAG